MESKLSVIKKIDRALKLHKNKHIDSNDVFMGDEIIADTLDLIKDDNELLDHVYNHYMDEFESYFDKESDKYEVEVFDEIDSAIKSCVDKIQNEFVRNEISRLSNGKKKKLRSKMAQKILSEKNYHFLAFIELMHLASLIQDDVVDKSDRRRFIKTTRALYDDSTAILVSDYLVMYIMNYFSKNNDEDIKRAGYEKKYNTHYDVFKKMIECEKNNKVDNIDEYYDYVLNKTGVFFGLCIANSYYFENIKNIDKVIYDKYYEFGSKYGVLFQIVDDLKDYYVDEKEFGKDKTDVANDSPNYFVLNKKEKKLHIKDLLLKVEVLYSYEESKIYDEEISLLKNYIVEKLGVV